MRTSQRRLESFRKSLERQALRHTQSLCRDAVPGRRLELIVWGDLRAEAYMMIGWEPKISWGDGSWTLTLRPWVI